VQPLPGGTLATEGTFEEDNSLCAEFVGETIPDALLQYLRCGYFTVPEEHAKPEGRSVRLPVVVIKSSSTKPAPDPLLVLQGGPGGSGIREYFGPILSQGFKSGEDRDVILVDQRGSFLAQPALICTEYRDLYIQQIRSNASGDAAAQERLAANAACKQRLEAEGVNLSAYNSFENASDIAQLPRALGYTDYNIYGTSYGSLLAQHIVARFPQGVRSLILDGVMPRAGNYALTRNANFQTTLQKVLEACQADAMCVKDFPDVQQRLLALVADLNASPAPMTVSSNAFTETIAFDAPLNGTQLLATLFFHMQDPSGTSRLPRLIDLLEKKDFAYLGRLRDLYELQPLRTTTLGLLNSVLCTEETNFTDAEARDADAAQADLNVFRGAAEIVELCRMWNVQTLPEDAQATVNSDIPTLVLSGGFDPIAPVENNEQAVSGFTNRTEVTFPARGHGQLLNNPCASSLVSNFLNAPTVELDTQCVTDSPPLEFSTTTLTLVPFTDAGARVGGVRPMGWLRTGPGAFGDDVTESSLSYIVREAADPAALEARLSESNARRTASRTAGEAEWSIYQGQVGDALHDIAISAGGLHEIALVTTDPAQRDALYETVFLPAIDSFLAIKAPSQVIVISEPTADSEVISPAQVNGVTARTPFENNLVYRVYNGQGLIISEGPINVKGDMGGPGAFAASLPFTVTQREAGRIEVIDINAATGEPFATAGVSVTLAPLNVELMRPIITITLESPEPNAEISSPTEVRGTISLTPFENSLVYRVFDAKGGVVGEGPITTDGEFGQPAAFTAAITFTVTESGPGRVLVEDTNEAGGPPFATSAVDVQLLAPASVTSTAEVTAGAAITLPAPITSTAEVTAGAAITLPSEASLPLSVDAFSLNPAGVARSVRKELMPAVAYDPNTPPGYNGVPEHVRFIFDRDRLDEYFAPRERQLLILPVADYLALYPDEERRVIDAQIAGLQDLLDTRPVSVTGAIPVLPAIGAAQVFHTNVDYIDFDGGACVRFITAYRQDVGPITDQDLFYTCQGLSNDGKYYVSFTYPVSSSATPVDANRVTRAELARIQANPDAYITGVANALDRLAASRFRPVLTRLDSMLATLKMPTTMGTLGAVTR
jgi:pimeloyl-ACP methyl ester carboxylesterase